MHRGMATATENGFGSPLVLCLFAWPEVLEFIG